MADVVDEFGLNAGRVWTALNSHGSLTDTQLMENTSLRTHELYAAIGWLARENKIRKNGELYNLDDTNLTGKIGRDAGKIWKLLVTEDKVDTIYVSKLTKMNEKDTYSALGWLAREGKIQIKK
ncbi:MAG: winged helix-turn-helix domain-containing protein [Thermoplasmatales archaeon]|nr:winged helix-turn-helix domain-containing protein [Thermoplasmatales archaeon]